MANTRGKRNILLFSDGGLIEPLAGYIPTTQYVRKCPEWSEEIIAIIIFINRALI